MPTLLDDLMARRPEARFEAELAPGQVEEFRDRGFIQVARITSDEELAWLRLVYDALFEERRGAYRGGYFDLSRPYESEGEDLVPQIITPEARFPQLKETAFWKNGRKLARQLLGDGAEIRVRRISFEMTAKGSGLAIEHLVDILTEWQPLNEAAVFANYPVERLT